MHECAYEAERVEVAVMLMKRLFRPYYTGETVEEQFNHVKI